MTARLVVLAGRPEPVADAVVWARTPVRVLAPAPGWVWVLPAGTGPVGMDRVVDEVSAVAPALLVTVTTWRSELQVWREEKLVRALAWEAGTVSGLDSDESRAAAGDLALLVAEADRAALARQLAGPRPGVEAWRDVVDLLGLPVPAGFVDLPADELLPGQGSVVHARGFLEAARMPATARPEEAPGRTPRPVSLVRALAAVVVVLACGSAVVTRTWWPILVGVAAVAAAIAFVGHAGSGRRPDTRPRDG